jgi:hypothetical protein
MSEATKERKELAAPSGSAECDNSFVSVLWRRLHSDLRRPSGWGDDLMEPYVREVVERTLKEFPPNIVLNNTEEAAK